MFLFIACLLRFAFGGNAISVILSAILGGTITFLALRALAKWADPDADAEMAWLTLISGAGWPLRWRRGPRAGQAKRPNA